MESKGKYYYTEMLGQHISYTCMVYECRYTTCYMFKVEFSGMRGIY